ncbi:MAG: TetR family transcriptional regulator [Alphaproteobacteria bacterium]
MTKIPTQLENKIAKAALQLLAKNSWQALTLEQIAKAAKVSTQKIKKTFSHKNDLLPAFIRYMDQETASHISKPSLRAPPHDRLFDVLMTRFEILQKHRTAILKLADEVKRDPSLLRLTLPTEIKAMQKVLHLAGLHEEGPQELIATTGLLALYGIVLCTWQNDQTHDLSKTMATLDRHLRYAGKIADIIFRLGQK